MKTKLSLVGIILILLATTFFQTKSLINTKKDRARISKNFQNSLFKMDSVINANGNLQFSVEALELKKKEAEQFNAELLTKVESMGIKIKNLQSVTSVGVEYVYITDTIEVESKHKSDTISTYIAKHKDKWLDLVQHISIHKIDTVPGDNKGNDIDKLVVDNFKLTVYDELTLPYEINYKRRWIFWRKPVSVTVHVMGESPYLEINKIESISLIK